MRARLVILLLYCVCAACCVSGNCYADGAIDTFTIQKAVKHFLVEQLEYSSNDVVVEIGRIPPHTSVPNRNMSISVQPADARNELKGKTIFFVTVYDNNKKLDRFPVTADIRLYADVVVNITRLNRYVTVEREDLSIEKREITNLRRPPFTNFDEVAGKRTTRVLRVGTILTANEVEDPPLVNKGDILTAILTDKNLQISLKAKALSEGWLGDTIVVKMINSMQRYRVKIYDAGYAVIQ